MLERFYIASERYGYEQNRRNSVDPDLPELIPVGSQ